MTQLSEQLQKNVELNSKLDQRLAKLERRVQRARAARLKKKKARQGAPSVE
jgi:uncharacterized small protein (DUF1192 family)